MKKQNLRLTRGDSRNLLVRVKLPDDDLLFEDREPYPLGALTSLRWTASRNNDNPFLTKALGAGVTITDGPAGEATVRIEPEDWDTWPVGANFLWDLEAKTISDTVTVAGGRLTVDKDISPA